MKDLEITKGKWLIDSSEDGTCIISDLDTNTICIADIVDESKQHWGVSVKAGLANAILIIDAGNTAQKCGLPPSELLEQRDELLEALSGLLRDFKEVISENNLEPQMAGYIGVAENLIKKATK